MILPVLTGKGCGHIKSCLSGVTVVVCSCYQTEYVFTWYLPQRYITDCHSVLCWSVVNAVDSAQGVHVMALKRQFGYWHVCHRGFQFI